MRSGPSGWPFLIGVAVGIALLVLLRLKAAAVIDGLERRGALASEEAVLSVAEFHQSPRRRAVGIAQSARAGRDDLFYSLCLGAGLTATWLTLFAFGLKLSDQPHYFRPGIRPGRFCGANSGRFGWRFHAAAAKGLEFLGLDPNLAASIAIVYHLIAFGPPFVIGLFYLIRDDISLGQLREMIASETELKDSIQPQSHRATETEREKGEEKRRSAPPSLYLSVFPALWLCGSVALSILKATGGIIL